ncbi:MAG: electron transfer flavoprotein subunit beta/FixA family protein [Candidatus Eiseniibacteriota bacterium]|jgi:electron transfer flavoprotein beta subunit
MIAIVLIKQVPETPNQIEWDPATQTLDIDKSTKVLNPYDQFAVEEAIKMREQDGGKVYVLALGPARTTEVIRECLAMGADEGVLLDDAAFQGGCGRSTARALVAAIKKIGEFDVILAGKRAIDSETAQIAPRIAAMLGVPVVSLVTRVESWDFAGKKVVLERALDTGKERVEARLPLVLTAEKDMNKPRYPSLISIRKASKKPISQWTPADLGLEPEAIGMAGSSLRVGAIETPPPRESGQIWDGDTDQAVDELVARLLETKVIG